MRCCRIRLVLLGLLLCVVHVVSGTCGQTFTDPSSSALKSRVVLEGKVKAMSEPGPNGVYNITVGVRKRVLKGEDLLRTGKRGKIAKSVTIARFKTGEADEKNCVGSVTKGRTYFFFLTDVKDPNGLFFELIALPIKKSKKLARTLRKILCKGCAEKPKIRKLTGPDGVSEGSKLTLRCSAKANPAPTFTWYKNGRLLTNVKGIRIKSGRRQSKLQVRRASIKDHGKYECLAVNAVGEDRKTFRVKVQSNKQKVPCDTQTYCLNGGTCMHSPDVGITFCVCPKNFVGSRCEKEEPGNLYERPGQATLLYERTLIVIGIVIAVLVFIVICIASYFMAKRRRKRFEAKRRRKEARRALKNDRTAEAIDRRPPVSPNRALKDNIHISCNDSTLSSVAPPGPVVAMFPKPETAPQLSASHAVNENANDIHHIYHQTIQQQQSQPLISERHNEARGRLEASSSMYDNCIDPPPTWRECRDPQKIIPVTSEAREPESFEMQPLGLDKSTPDSEERLPSQQDGTYSPIVAHSDSLDLPRIETPPQIPPHSSSLPAIQPIYSNHHNNVAVTPPSQFGHALKAPQSSSSPSSSLSHSSMHYCDTSSPQDDTDTADEPLLPPRKTSGRGIPPPFTNNAHSKSDRDLFSRTAASALTRHDRANCNGPERTGLLSGPPPHSHTFPRGKENGLGPFLNSEYDDDEDDDDDDESASEVPYLPHLDELHISEEELNLSGDDDQVSSSFNSVLTPSRQASCDESGVYAGVEGGTTPLLPGSRRRTLRLYQSEDVTDPSSASDLDFKRSHSLDNPDISSRSEYAGVIGCSHLNSTLAGSPDECHQTNSKRHHHHNQNHDCFYDPNEDGVPWDDTSDNDRPSNLQNLSEEQDRMNRLRDVYPDQQAIPI